MTNQTLEWAGQAEEGDLLPLPQQLHHRLAEVDPRVRFAWYRSIGSFGSVPAIELGLGYTAGTARFEMLVEYRPRFAFERRANFLAPDRRQSVSADLSSVSGMLVGFVDLAALGLPKPGHFAPFVGAGIGAVHTRIGKTTMTFPATTTTVPGGSRVGLAWMATAGVAVALDERVSVDIA